MVCGETGVEFVLEPPKTPRLAGTFVGKVAGFAVALPVSGEKHVREERRITANSDRGPRRRRRCGGVVVASYRSPGGAVSLGWYG